MSHFQTHLDNETSIERSNLEAVRKRISVLKQWNHNYAVFYADRYSYTDTQMTRLSAANDAVIAELKLVEMVELETKARLEKAYREADFNRHMENCPVKVVDKTPKNDTMN